MLSRLYVMSKLRSLAAPVAAFHRSAVPASDKLFLHRDSADNNAKLPFKFNDANQKTATSIIAKYPAQYKKAAVIPLLDLGQRQHGFTSLSVMNTVAQMLEMPPMRVYEVATFYTMFNRDKVGKHFVQVCTTTPCELCGSAKIVDAAKEYLGIGLGETTKDGMFTLVEVECQGACVNAPMVCVNDDFYEDLTEASVVKVLQELKAGKKPKPGSLAGRHSCEPKGKPTSLTTEFPPLGSNVRKDL